MSLITRESPVWDRNQHNEILKQGNCRIHEGTSPNGKQHIFIELRESKATGYGTASMRDIMEKSLSKNLEVYNRAAWSSHTFHIFMGMMPFDWISVAASEFGRKGISVLKNHSDLRNKLLNQLELSAEDQNDLNYLKSILLYINTNDHDTLNASQITDNEFLESENKFNEFLLLQSSYINNDFVQLLLNLLEKQKDEHRIDTSSLGYVNMKMSKIGAQRWKSAIENDQHFVPFKRFEHLHKYMSVEQIAKLNEVMDYRENLFPSKI